MRLQDNEQLRGALRSTLLENTDITAAYCTMPKSSFEDAIVYITGVRSKTPSTRTIAELLTTTFRDMEYPVREVKVVDCVLFGREVPSHAESIMTKSLPWRFSDEAMGL